MGAEIDRLEVQVDAEASRANSALDKLVDRLDKISASLGKVNGSGLVGLANGVSKLGTAMQSMSNLKATDFKRIATGINKLGTVNTASLNSAASSMSHLVRAFNNLGTVSVNASQIGDLAKNLSKLGNKGVTNAITNLPQLATGLNNLMATLSRAPVVSNNLIQMTNALANLASNGNRVGSTSRSLVSGLNSYSSSANRARKSSLSLVAAFGRFYASWFLAIRGVKKLWSSIETSMGYIETLNYFNAAFGQVADAASNDWQQIGYDSAEAYYNSFSERAKELTSKMTGFSVNEDGTLTSTGNQGLGIDPNKLMQYQATFAQMSSSMGITSENALKVSRALTEIGADLASVRNMDFDKVWNDMASGLAGMSRTLDKYGVNIRNVNLQQRLSELGIEANIAALNQNDKALLRTIILLDSTRYAWGDLADTISMPANQLRLISSNFENLARTIGNLFLPIVSKALPYVNALIISLQRLFTWVGSLFGLDLSEITNSVGSSEIDMSDFADSAEDAAGALDDAAGSAEKLNRQTRKWDEINNLSSRSESGSSNVSLGGIDSSKLDAALDDILSEYQIAWDEAFANMENRAQEMANRLDRYFEPLKEIIMDFKVGDFFKAGEDTGKLTTSIFRYITNDINSVNWKKLGDNVAKFLNGMFKNIKGKDIAEGINSLVNAIWNFFYGVLKKFNYGNLVRIFGGVLANLDWDTIAKLGIAVGGVKLAKNFITSFIRNFKKEFVQRLVYALQSPEVSKALTGVVSVIGEYALVKDAVHGLYTETGSVLGNLTELVASAGIASAALYTAFGPAGLAVSGIAATVGAIGGIKQALDEAVDESIGNSIRDALTVPGGVTLDEITEMFTSSMQNIGDSFSVLADESSKINEADKNIQSTVAEIEKIKIAMDNGVLSVEEGKEKLSVLFEQLSQIATDKFSNISSLIVSAFGENGVVRKSLDKAGGDATELVSTVIGLESDVTGRLAEIRTKLSQMSPEDIGFDALYEEYLKLIGATDDAETALNDFKLSIESESIDYSGLLTDENELDTGALNRYLGDISASYSDAETTIEGSVSGINAALAELSGAAGELGNIDAQEIINTSIGNMPSVLENTRGELSSEALLFSDTLQTDLINNISNVIEEASEEWENLDPLEKFAAGNQEKYVSDAITRYQDNVIDPVSAKIEEQYSKMGISGAGWAADASETIIDGLYDPANFQNKDRTENIYAIAEDYEGVIKKGLEKANPKIKTYAEKTGNYLYDGLKSGLSYEFDKTKTLMENFAKNQIANPFSNGLEIHSPSKLFEDYGMYIVLGFNKGVEDNKSVTYSKMEDFVLDIKSAFDGLQNSFTDIGENAMSGLQNGLSSMASSVWEKAKSIADGIKEKMQSALDIHSPSRVMFELGGYTMQGFQNGLESLYKPILESEEAFCAKLQTTQIPDAASFYGNSGYTYDSTSMKSYGTLGEYTNRYQQDISETNNLLRELLYAVKEGKSININGTEVFQEVINENEYAATMNRLHFQTTRK